MTLLEKKIFTMFYIKEHKNLTKKERHRLFNFVEQATEDQIDRLLKTGKPDFLPKYISEESDAEYFARMQKNAWIEYGKRMKDLEAGSPDKGSAASALSPNLLQGAAIAVVVAAALAAGYLIYTKVLSKAARACKGVADKKSCMQKFKIDAQKAKVQKLQQSMSLCVKSKDPAKCKAKLSSKIAKERSKLGA